MKFEVVGEVSPFLVVTLDQGETVYAESGAMVSMSQNLDLSGEVRGGILGAITRRLVADESLFTQKVEAKQKGGQVLFAPTVPGDIEVLEVCEHRSFFLNDGVFLAAGSKVDLKIRLQNLGNALFGGTGGFFIVEARGQGPLAVGGFGSVLRLQVKEDEDLVVDNQHVVAWESSLHYQISMSTSKSKGFFGNALNSALSGEGLVTRFSGKGTVYLSSRNIQAFTSHLLTTGGLADQIAKIG